MYSLGQGRRGSLIHLIERMPSSIVFFYYVHVRNVIVLLSLAASIVPLCIDEATHYNNAGLFVVICIYTNI
jgi:hypothetical protein